LDGGAVVVDCPRFPFFEKKGKQQASVGHVLESMR